MGAFHKFAAEEADKTKTAIYTRRIIVIVDAPPGVLVYAMRKYSRKTSFKPRVPDPPPRQLIMLQLLANPANNTLVIL